MEFSGNHAWIFKEEGCLQIRLLENSTWERVWCMRPSRYFDNCKLVLNPQITIQDDRLVLSGGYAKKDYFTDVLEDCSIEHGGKTFLKIKSIDDVDMLLRNYVIFKNDIKFVKESTEGGFFRKRLVPRHWVTSALSAYGRDQKSEHKRLIVTNDYYVEIVE